MKTLSSALRISALLVATVALIAVPATGHAATAHAATPSTATLTAPTAPPKRHTVTLASTIQFGYCSASLVRYLTSRTWDRAMMLTNGHCYEGGLLPAGQVLVNVPSSRTGTLLNSSGGALGTVHTDRVLYATMTGTDVALYRLTQTYRQITRMFGATALTISARHPVDGRTISIPSAYWKVVYSCSINGFVGTLEEDQWTWHDSIRYLYPNSNCETIGGTSGSPILDDRSGQLVGINNTSNEDGQSCTLDNPCEVNADGSITVLQGRDYGQETYWFNTCLTAANAIDLTKTGCLLTKP